MVSILVFISFLCEEISNPSIGAIKAFASVFKKYRELICYVIVGGLTTCVSIGSYALFRALRIDYLTSTILSWVVAVCFAYISNRIFVFASKNAHMLSEFLKFLSCRLLTLGIEVVVMYIMVDLLSIHDMIAKIVVQIIVTILNYILSKILVFRKKK